MPIYDFTCRAGHVAELVRPHTVRVLPCPTCGDIATRSEVHRFDVVGPTVDTRGMSRRFTEAAAEREHIYQGAEARTGEAITRPNDWAIPEARAREKLRRGEVDAKAVARTVQSERTGGLSLGVG